MLKPQLAVDQHYCSSLYSRNLFPQHIASFASNPLRDQINRKYNNSKSHNGVHNFRVIAGKDSKIKAVSSPTRAAPVALSGKDYECTVTLKVIDQGSSKYNVFFGGITVQLVAAEKGPDGKNKKPLEQNAKQLNGYTCTFKVGKEFGEIGAVILEHGKSNEVYVEEIDLVGSPAGKITLHCKSWVQPDTKRVFFTNKSYLPSQTPSGLVDYREFDLSAIRGDGKGKRKEGDRIYDYDVYNDLGDSNKEGLDRKVLGGNKTLPYPRRCRTGRSPASKMDKSSESRIDAKKIYVPRDERFSEIKQSLFDSETISGIAKAIDDFLLDDTDLGFPCFTEIDQLYNEFGDLPEEYVLKSKKILARFTDFIEKFQGNLLCFDTPELLDRDKFAWMKDEEFGRQTLAGVNPCTIQLVKEWPLKSNLDPAVYGDPKSAITKENVELMTIRGMTLEEAIEQKRLFVIDYHDFVLPFVEEISKLEGRNIYGSRALFLRTPKDTLKPIAIELVRPPYGGKPVWKKAYMPSSHGTSGWLWKLAKAQFLAIESGYHQLISHWLRTHCVVEPFAIATNRQLSAMHPIYRLLKPHFKDTMAINALARGALINAGGIIETSFSPGKYSVELSSVAYRDLWRFDQEGLPADLIRRGMAEEDSTSKTGVKLTIEDYPYASDGILLWTIIKDWVKAYVTHYYPDASHIKSDKELNNWWTEIRTVGHGDKKDEPWWPKLQTAEDLVGILTTMIWIPSGHHAAVNFGQYDFAAYFPNRPTIARTKMPNEDQTDESWAKFLLRPEDTLLACFPTLGQASAVAITLKLLSQHSEDEEYIGQKPEPSWAENSAIMAEFESFTARLKELESIIDERNNTMENRNGAGLIPYTLLKASSKEHGITRTGVPNSVSI